MGLEVEIIKNILISHNMQSKNNGLPWCSYTDYLRQVLITMYEPIWL